MFYAGLLGFPIEHSLSPVLFTASFKAMHILGEYKLLPARVEDFTKIVSGLSTDYRGLSVTMPNKRVALEFCDSRVSVAAKTIGAVNTLFRDSADNWVGENTDYVGVQKVLQQNFPEVLENASGQIILLGAGGTACSVVYALASLGFQRVRLLVRNTGRVAEVSRLAKQLNIQLAIDTLETEQLDMYLSSADLLINTLPVDYGEGNFQRFARVPRALDVLYIPRPTPLVKSVLAAGGKAVDGLGMLVYQAVEQFKLFTGQAVPVEVMQRAVGLDI